MHHLWQAGSRREPHGCESAPRDVITIGVCSVPRGRAKATSRGLEASRTAGHRRFVIPLTIAMMIMTGCRQAGSSDGRHRVLGRITLAGEPVTQGEVLFTPDGARGNSGPQGLAIIGAGRYDTLGTRAPGAAAGSVIVRVTALATAQGPVLAEYEFQMEVEPGGMQHDIDIPASAVAPAGVAKPDI